MTTKLNILAKSCLFLLVCTHSVCLWGQTQFDYNKATIFDEVGALVAQHFYDKNFDVKEWNNRIIAFRLQAIAAKTEDEFSSVINELLQTLNTSHTQYYSKLNPKRYQILGIFHSRYGDSKQNLYLYEGIGIDTRMIDNKIYVVAVYDGFAAAEAGIQFGDQIITVDNQPFQSIASFLGKKETGVQIKLQRLGKEITLKVAIDWLDGRTMFEKALKSSVNVFTENNRKIGYLHVWSYAGSKYQEIIRSMILWGKLVNCDALILDLRDGWGGADVNYLNLFRTAIVNVSSESRSQPLQNYTGVWGKPIALITNNGSTSGKELFAYGFKKLKLGKIFGEKTAGAVVAGRSFLLSNGDVLYLAVSDVKVDGHRLESHGIEPDYAVPRSITQPSAVDKQLQASIRYLSEK
jgi:carboxyl-terminal processing protease